MKEVAFEQVAAMFLDEAFMEAASDFGLLIHGSQEAFDMVKDLAKVAGPRFLDKQKFAEASARVSLDSFNRLIQQFNRMQDINAALENLTTPGHGTH